MCAPIVASGDTAQFDADERRPFDALEIVDLDALSDPDVSPQADARDIELDQLVERVEVRLPVLLEVADVLPVALADVAVERAAELQQAWEELLREVERRVFRNLAEHGGIEHVDARVDRVGEDLSPRRLLEEPLDATALPRHDDAEVERVVDRLQRDRDGGVALGVEPDEAREVEVRQRVA